MMLESNRDDVKLEAMRCVTVMTAKGKLSVPRTLFPHIVKNVSSKNPELKKLIYLYLTNFADQEPDLALLPVATLQKSLKSPNPLIRSSALKVLTSMRLNILSAILMATLRSSINDLSPYVRKTVAHSIIKIYRLDSGLRGDLIEYIERLFSDKNSMVLSSAVASFEVVCPERLDLVQQHYKRFCFTLADCNEWGQTMMLNLLKRYILKNYKGKSKQIDQDQDPKTLLRSAKPLIHSNNSAVVMAVIKLYIAIANHNEVRSTITRPLIRLLTSHREIQSVVLSMIENLTTLRDTEVATAELESDDETVPEVVPSNENNNISLKTDEVGPSIMTEHSSVTSDTSNHLIETSVVDPPQEVSREGYIPLDGEENSAAVVSPTSNNSQTEENHEKDNGDVKRTNEKESDDEEEETASDEEETDSDEDDEDDDDESDDEEDEDEESEADNPVEEQSSSKAPIDETHNDDEDDQKVLHASDVSSNKDPNAYREVFRPYIKSFFVKHNDCTQIRLAKLRILTNLASSVNVSLVLRELQAYISTYVEDREFVSGAIHAIGRCAVICKEIAHTCLNGLTTLLSNKNEHIVSEAIVVLRSQIIDKKPSKAVSLNGNNGVITEVQSKDEASKEETMNGSNGDENGDETPDSYNEKMVSTVIKQVTRLMPTVTAPQARATILWILAEFCDKNRTAAKCTPEVLRQVAKSFCQEDNFVKLQALTLVSKFLLSLDVEKKAELYHKIQLLAGYLFSLAKYDINHDVRDRGRFLKKLLESEEICVKVLSDGSSIN